MACLEEIQKRDLKEESVGLSEVENKSRKELRLEFDRVLAMEEVMWRQRSRVQWLKEEDNNTKFFHKMANAHKAINSIGLQVNGARVKDEETIKSHVEDHFRSLFLEQRPFRPKVDGLIFPQFDE